MKLQKVKPPKMLYTCIKCGKKTPEVYADLDGKPFVDYYCEECTKSLTL